MVTTSHGIRLVESASPEETITLYITPEQDQRLHRLHDRTKVPLAEYIRQGIDLILKKRGG